MTRLLTAALLAAVIAAATPGAAAAQSLSARGVATPSPAASVPPLSLSPTGRDLLLAGALLGAAAFLDRNVHEELTVEGSPSLTPLARAGNEMGRQRNALAALALLYGVGRVSRRPGLSDGALRAVAGLAATGLADQGLKRAVGRDRPALGGDADEFRPFDPSGSHHSFPSHHTALAFSLATTVAEETRDPRWSAAAYAAAGLVGWSRIHQGEHWASDVAGGAIVGTFTTRAVNRWLRSRMGSHGPAVGVSPNGVVVQVPAF